MHFSLRVRKGSLRIVENVCEIIGKEHKFRRTARAFYLMNKDQFINLIKSEKKLFFTTY